MGSQTFSDQDVAGGRFISSMANRQMLAAFFHPSKLHYDLFIKLNIML